MREPRPVGDLTPGRRAERAKVATNNVRESCRLGWRRWWNPRLSQPVKIRTALVPGAGRRNAHHIDPHPDAGPCGPRETALHQTILQGAGALWPRFQRFADHRGCRIDVDIS